jgi:hypothetical protein
LRHSNEDSVAKTYLLETLSRPRRWACFDRKDDDAADDGRNSHSLGTKEVRLDPSMRRETDEAGRKKRGA